MKIHDLLKTRYKIAQSYTKKFQEEVKKCIKDYECEGGVLEKDDTVIDRHLYKKRYEFKIPYIFSTHESMLAELFAKPPELLFKGKGAMDDDKAILVEAIYKYLYDKLDLEGYLINAAWWFLLVGFVSGYQEYKIEVKGYNTVPDAEGNPMLDEEGKPIEAPEYGYHDPIAYVDDPLKTFFAPDSEFSIDAKGVPYIIREKLVDTEELEEIYGIEIEPDAEVKISAKESESDDVKSDLERAKVLYYTGKLCDDVKEDKETLAKFKIQLDEKKMYYAVFTNDKLIHIEEIQKNCALARWYSVPNKFFGYGIGKTLRSVQKEMSIRRGQQVRYADLYAFPWLAVNGETTVDQKALMDPYKRVPLIYQGQTPPQYIIPPALPSTIVDADNISRSDAQFISGTLDMSKGSQESNTVKTATGQQIFAQSADKRTQKARMAIARHFRQVVINLFKLCRDNWEEDKIIRITDDDGLSSQVEVNVASLQDIDFDTDIDISIDSISVNEDIISERATALYDKVKDDPLVDRRKIFKKMLKVGFKEKNPDAYMLPEGEEGTQPTQEPPQGAGGEMPQDMPPEDMGGGDMPLVGNQLSPDPAL